MSDRELLERAAKAAGRTVMWESAGVPWNPLEDDGQALRLAVKQSLVVAVKGHECEVFSESGDCLASVPIMGASCFANSAEATNPYAATRRCIVRAAAAMAGDTER